MTRPRVLLVEDDSMLRQFARMALEELPLDLLEADSVAAALQLLQTAPVQLILTDLMMPGASGLDFLEHLHQQPGLRGNARVVVLSAGVTTAMRERLLKYTVWRVLLKPVPVREALADALSAAETAPTRATGICAVPGHAAATAVRPASAQDLSAQQTQALQAYFGGDSQLFDAYLASCRTQFASDVLAGDLALQLRDLASLRHLAHSLKTVLRTLGYPGVNQTLALEEACLGGQQVAAELLWAGLRAQLQSLIHSG